MKDGVMKWICAACLIVSIIAGYIAVRAQAESRRIANEVVQQREQQIIDNLWPKIQQVYEDIGDESGAASVKRPMSIEQLFEPLLRTLEIR